MSDPTGEERACIEAGLRVLAGGGTVGARSAGGYKVSKGIAVAELPSEALWNEQPLTALALSGRRFIGVSDDAVIAFDLSYGEDGPRLARTTAGPLAEATLEALADAEGAEAEDLLVVRVRGLSAEGLWIRDGGRGVTTILPANGAMEGEDFIEASRRLTRHKQPGGGI